MTLSLDEVTARSRAVVAQERRDVEVVGVLSSVGGSGHVELLVMHRDCRDEPCRAMLSLTRMDDAAFEADLRMKLKQTLLPRSDQGSGVSPEH